MISTYVARACFYLYIIYIGIIWVSVAVVRSRSLTAHFMVWYGWTFGGGLGVVLRFVADRADAWVGQPSRSLDSANECLGPDWMDADSGSGDYDC